MYVFSIQGIVGSSVSGKSDLLHRYLTGEYAKVDSFTGRHKKEVCLDGQSRLLLIRNETGPPDVQVLIRNIIQGNEVRASKGVGGGRMFP